MTTPQLPSARHVLRAGVPAALGPALAILVILGLYIWMPEPNGDDPPWLAFIGIVVIFVLYALVAVWALFRIHKSKHPLRTGVTMLALMVTSLIVIFSLAYLALSHGDPGAFNEPIDKISALYFTMTILTTVGFGDIHAVSHAAMIAVMVQMLLSLTLITALGRILIEASRRANKARLNERYPGVDLDDRP